MNEIELIIKHLASLRRRKRDRLVEAIQRRLVLNEEDNLWIAAESRAAAEEEEERRIIRQEKGYVE